MKFEFWYPLLYPTLYNFLGGFRRRVRPTLNPASSRLMANVQEGKPQHSLVILEVDRSALVMNI